MYIKTDVSLYAHLRDANAKGSIIILLKRSRITLPDCPKDRKDNRQFVGDVLSEYGNKIGIFRKRWILSSHQRSQEQRQVLIHLTTSMKLDANSPLGMNSNVGLFPKETFSKSYNLLGAQRGHFFIETQLWVPESRLKYQPNSFSHYSPC
jgi:hypothetical protein